METDAVKIFSNRELADLSHGTVGSTFAGSRAFQTQISESGFLPTSILHPRGPWDDMKHQMGVLKRHIHITKPLKLETVMHPVPRSCPTMQVPH